MAVSLLLLVLIVAVGAIVIGDIRQTEADRIASGCDLTNASDQGSCTQAVNISTDGLSGLSNMSAQFGTVGTVVIAAVLISLVIGAFAIQRRL